MHPHLAWCALAALALWGDAAAVKALHQHLSPALDDLFERLSGLADARVAVATALCMGTAGLLARHRAAWAGRAVHAGALMLLVLLSGGLTVLLLKHLVARARPWLLLEQGFYGVVGAFAGAPFNAFPSSHAFTAFAVAAVLAHRWPAWRWPVWALAGGVAACRVFTLAHFPSDVLASALIARACLGFWVPRLPQGVSQQAA